MISFYKTEDRPKVALILSDKISAGLDRGKVLWLIGGGSVIDIAVEVARRLQNHTNLGNLVVSLTDERFGPVGHPDSNWQQLLDRGFLLNEARLIPVLEGNGLDETVSAYADMLDRKISSSDYSISLGGMGADGHILGIKPHSDAVSSQGPVVSYRWDDYVRITPTAQLLKRLDEVIIYANGAEKHAQLDRIEQEVSPQEQPAQLLKQAKQVSIYNDYKGEKL